MHSSWAYKVWSTIGVLLHILFFDIPADLYRWLTMRQKDVSNQVIVITGGGSGLGQAMALNFAKRNAKVAIIDVSQAGGEETVKLITEADGIAKFWKCDTTSEDGMASTAKDISGHFGDPDIVICNAAVLHFSLFKDISNKDLKKSLDVNIFGTLNTIRAFLKRMEETNRGHVVCISSIAGFSGETYGLAYCSSKFAVRGAMECLQMELRDRGLDGIKCTTICPYFARTPMILSNKMRPTCTWFPFMSVRSCSRRMVDAILKEKVLAFVPSYITLVPLIKSFLSFHLLKSLRDYLGIKYTPTNQEENTSFVSMVYFFKSPHVAWVTAVVPGLLITFLAWLSPDRLDTPFLPLIGPLAAHIGRTYPTLVFYISIGAIVAHVSEALYALSLCRQANIQFDCTAKWVIQTFIVGFPSLSILIKYIRRQKKNH